MKKNTNFLKIVGSLILLSTVIIGFDALQKKSVFAEENEDYQIISEIQPDSTITEQSIDNENTDFTSNYENPTVQAAIEIAKVYPDYWASMFDDGHSNESTTVLVMPEGAFMYGQIELETGQIWNSDTDPNATTLGEILAALRENGLDPFE
ncbi:hypothetical protein [Enterococcus sp. CWB-B31]|uniref:hypothetical protein n=1 Tax=Enterococcus sp. CWB-B31 TaxID=2885159 RepID=UPI001E36EA7A|nr:hypothetical protein [Enterococcus sp. CWB-B31]MCB5955549.1 hypothetical protein [Enterococcus sp. CWB-B31]